MWTSPTRFISGSSRASKAALVCDLPAAHSLLSSSGTPPLPPTSGAGVATAGVGAEAVTVVAAAAAAAAAFALAFLEALGAGLARGTTIPKALLLALGAGAVDAPSSPLFSSSSAAGGGAAALLLSACAAAWRCLTRSWSSVRIWAEGLGFFGAGLKCTLCDMLKHAISLTLTQLLVLVQKPFIVP